MNPSTSAERIFWSRPEDLPGVEVARAQNATTCVRLLIPSYYVGLHRRGALECRYRGKSRQIAPGTLGFLEPGDLYVTTRVPRPASSDGLFIDPAIMVRAALDVGLAPSGLRIRVDEVSRADWFDSYTKLLASLESTSTRLERQSRFAQCLEVFLGNVGGVPRLDIRRGAERSAVRRVREYLHERAAEPIALDDLADTAGLSRFHLLRAFRQEIGLPPHAYQIQIRIAEARRLISRGVPHAQVAAAVGFSDQSHFIRHFRKWSGATPGEYARSIFGSRPQASTVFGL